MGLVAKSASNPVAIRGKLKRKSKSRRHAVSEGTKRKKKTPSSTAPLSLAERRRPGRPPGAGAVVVRHALPLVHFPGSFPLFFSSPTSPWKKQLYSFPYAGALATGGILAWGNKKSLPSLVFAGVSSSILCMAALRSLAAFDRGETSRSATAVSLAVSVVIAVAMGQRYLETGKSYPGLWVAVPSAFMALFYVWCLRQPSKGGKGKKKTKAIAAAPAGSPPKRMTRAAAATKKRA